LPVCQAIIRVIKSVMNLQDVIINHLIIYHVTYATP
jgi:thioredoxin-related protein